MWDHSTLVHDVYLVAMGGGTVCGTTPPSVHDVYLVAMGGGPVCGTTPPSVHDVYLVAMGGAPNFSHFFLLKVTVIIYPRMAEMHDHV